MSEDMREIGERIKSRMPEGMTQQSLAEAMEMTPDALSRMLNGKRGITMTESWARLRRCSGPVLIGW